MKLSAGARAPQQNPDDCRMSLGEHLEELRRRVIFALIGLAIVFAGCLVFGQRVMATFCGPLIRTLRQYEVSPQVYFTQVGDPFLVFMQISMISAAALASPWIVYQLWLFIAAGLYPYERRVIRKFVPLSLGLLIGGMLFVYYLVLPWTLQFFMAFSLEIPLPSESSPAAPATAPAQVWQVPLLSGDPARPVDGELWYDTLQRRLKVFVAGQVRVIPFGPQNLVAPMITLPDYIDLVLGMLLTFGLAFQLPLVVVAAVRVGIVEAAALRKGRKYVLLAMTALAAVITPGDVITATLLLIIPLVLLYELGIWLAGRGEN